jgi:hypothetical protein
LFRIQIVSTFAVLFEKGKSADVAQLVEQLICNQLVGGSNPSIGSELRITPSLEQFENVL